MTSGEYRKLLTPFNIALLVVLMLLSFFFAVRNFHAAESGGEIGITTDEYHRAVMSLLNDSVKRLDDVSPENTYLYSYYLNVLDHYDRLTDLELPGSPVVGWNEFFSLETPVLFITTASLALFCRCFTVDTRSRMDMLIGISKNGGRRTVSAKLRAIASLSTGITVVFSLSPLAAAGLVSGLSDPAAPVQALGALTYCRYRMTIWQYLVVFILLRILIFLCLSLLIAVAGQYTGSELTCVVLTVLISVSGVLMSGIRQSSELYFLRRFSPKELSGINALFERYRGLRIFGFCADYTVVVILAFLLMSAAAVCAMYLCPRKASVRENTSRGMRVSGARLLPLTVSEIYKQLISGRGIYVLTAALAVRCVVSAVYYRQPSGSTEEVYREYIGRVAGAPTEENLLYISEEESRIKSVLSEHSAVMTAYRNGKLSGDEYAEHMSRYSYAEYCGRACEMLVERRDYILSIPDEYSGVEFIYDRGILLFMKSPADIPALMVVVFIASRIFASERDSGFSYILRASKRGRRETSGAKLAAVTVMSSMVYLVFCVVDLIFLCLNYGTSGFGAGIMSIPEMSYTGLDMSVLGYAVIEKIIQFVGYLETVLFVTGISALCSESVAALIISFAALAVPAVVSYYLPGITGALSFVRFSSVSDVSGAFPCALVCTICMFVTLSCGLRSWNGEKIHFTP